MFALWLGISYLIKVYDDFLPDAFADKIYDLHTIGNFNWFFASSSVLARGIPTDNLDVLYKKVTDNITVGYRGGDISHVLDTNTIDTPYLVHSICNDGQSTSPHFEQVSEMLKYLDIERGEYSFDRIKSNLCFNVSGYKKTNYQPIHLDKPSKGYMSLLYYVNDSDGDTIFFDKNIKVTKRVNPKKNRAILFDSNILHAGSNPIKSKKRIVINTIFKMEKT